MASATVWSSVVAFAQWACAWVCEHAPVAADATARASRRAWEKARCAWALALAAYRVSVVQRALASHDFVVFKAVAVNEEDGTDATVTKLLERGDGAWEDGVRAATGWRTQELRVEVRYLAHGKKFRAILRPGDVPAFPPAPERHRGGPRGVMSAELVGDDVAVNITRRVLKYQGPGKDFHSGLGLRVGVTDLFPYDDPADVMNSFHTLRVIDAHARLVHLPVECEDLAGALAAEGKAE